MNDDRRHGLTVFYDGLCPVCELEVGFYRRLDAQGRIVWKDINRMDDGDLPKGRTRQDLLGIFHAGNPDTGWATGVDAFGAIWRQLPGFRHVWWIFRVPVIRQVAHLFYRLFLAWQRRHRRKRIERAALAQNSRI